MATGNISNVDSTGNLLSLLTALKGSSSTSTTTISPEGLTALINNSLGSTQGLAAVAQGQKSAGLYNSSTNQLLVNDLLTRTAAQAAAVSSSTTKKNNPQISNQNILMGLGAAGLKSLLGPTVSGLAKKSGVDQWGNKLENSLGLGTGSGGSDFVGPPSSLAGDGGLAGSLSDYGSSIPTAGSEDLGSLDFSSGGTDAVSGGVSSAVEDSGSDLVSSAVDSSTEDEGASFLSSLFG